MLSLLERRFGVDIVSNSLILAAVAGAALLGSHQSWTTCLLLALGLTWAVGLLGRCLRGKAARMLLLDFSVFPIPEECKMTREEVLDMFQAGADFTPEALEAHRALLFGNDVGIGDRTALPAALHRHRLQQRVPFDQSLQAGLDELELAAYTAVADALRAARVQATEVDILLTATNMIVPVPSVSAMVANRFGMREDLRSYSLGGQGCASGVLVVGLAQSLLAAAPRGAVALVVLHESMTLGLSLSSERGCAASNCLFRMNGAAVVLSSRRRDRGRAKYELLHAERTLLTGDAAFGCIQVRQDREQKQGVFLRKRDVVDSATRGMRAVLKKLAPLILPLPQLARAALLGRKPDLAAAIDHILIHTGAALIITSVADALALGPKAAVPSSETLARFGNTSVCSTYYVLAYIESRLGVAAGERVLQLSFGSGFKSAANYWRALRDVRHAHPAWEG